MTYASNASGPPLPVMPPESITTYGCPSSRHDFPADVTFTPGRDLVLSEARRLLDDDAHAAYMVAACVSCVQSGTETRPAFVKRLVRAWIDEMGRGE